MVAAFGRTCQSLAGAGQGSHEIRKRELRAKGVERLRTTLFALLFISSGLAPSAILHGAFSNGLQPKLYRLVTRSKDRAPIHKRLPAIPIRLRANNVLGWDGGASLPWHDGGVAP